MNYEISSKLGIEKLNLGNSTGSNWMEHNSFIDSISPVDGKIIASVQITDIAIYNNILQTEQ